MQQYLDRHRFLKGIYLMVRRYFDHHVGRDSAALTYYLLFALFPLLIFLSNLVGIMSVVIIGGIVFFLIAMMYGLAQESHRMNRIWPGAVFSLVMWLVLSFLFSYYVENIARYSVIYGTLGAVIVLLLWLYLASVMLIMGAEFNSVLMVLRKQHTAEAEENLGETQK